MRSEGKGVSPPHSRRPARSDPARPFFCEAASLAPALDVAVRHKLDIRYLTNGQRVPEDLHLPNRAYLLHRALREHGGESPWHLSGDEAGMLLAAAGGA